MRTLKLFIARLYSATLVPNQAVGTRYKVYDVSTGRFDRVWIQGVVISMMDAAVMIDDGTGCALIRITTSIQAALSFELKIGTYVLIHGGVLEQKIDSVVPIVHAMQVAELNPDDEAIWMLEVVDAERHFIGVDE